MVTPDMLTSLPMSTLPPLRAIIIDRCHKPTMFDKKLDPRVNRLPSLIFPPLPVTIKGKPKNLHPLPYWMRCSFSIKGTKGFEICIYLTTAFIVEMYRLVPIVLIRFLSI